jgi:hypothetical protein
MDWIALAIKLVPAILTLVQWIVQRASDKSMIAEGERQAILLASLNISAKVSVAKSIEDQAKADHNAKPNSDDAFDKDFKRN